MNCFFCSGPLSVHLVTAEYKIVKCRQCGNAYTDPKPSHPDYEQLDFGNVNTVGGRPTVKQISDLPIQWQELIQCQAEMANRYLAAGSKVLEIGCGEGLLLAEIAKKGHRVTGVEPSHNNAARARLREIVVLEQYFDSSVIKEKFDLVIISHVLEHVEYPDKIIQDIVNVMNPGAILMLTQTNYPGMIPAMLKEKWYAWVPEQHYWHFTPKGLMSWLQTSGFKLEQEKYISLVHPSTLKYSIVNLFNSLFPSLMDQYILLFQRN